MDAVPRPKKLALVGSCGVGMSCLLTRLVDGKFEESPASTIGVDFKIFTSVVDGEAVKLHIWDLGSNEKGFGFEAQGYWSPPAGIVALYDVTSRDSFDHIKRVLTAQSKENAGRLLLIGTKSDAGGRAVTFEEAQAFAAGIGVMFRELSAKDDHGNTEVRDAFNAFTRQLLRMSSIVRSQPKRQPHQARRRFLCCC